MLKLAENYVEQAALVSLSGLGYEVLHGADISSEGRTPEGEARALELPRDLLLPNDFSVEVENAAEAVA